MVCDYEQYCISLIYNMYKEPDLKDKKRKKKPQWHYAASFLFFVITYHFSVYYAFLLYIICSYKNDNVVAADI